MSGRPKTQNLRQRPGLPLLPPNKEMPTTPRKRARTSGGAPLPSVVLSPEAARFAAPSFWRHLPAAVGAPGADAFLCHLGRSVLNAVRAVNETAEASRDRLFQLRSVLHAAIDGRCDELERLITGSEKYKIAALERELINIDATLERYRAECRAVGDAAAAAGEAEFVAQQAALSSRLGDIKTELRALPTASVEPPQVFLTADVPSLLAAVAVFGGVIAPLPVTAAHLTLRRVPSIAQHGDPLRLQLRLGARHSTQTAEELEVSLGQAAAATLVEGWPIAAAVKPQALRVTVSADVSLRCLVLTLPLPAFCSAHSSVCISSITVAGQPVAGLPMRFSVHRGLRAPLRLVAPACCFMASPCISPEGLLYAALPETTQVRVFDALGAPQPGLFKEGLGLSDKACWAAYASGETPSLVLADCEESSRLVAVDPVTLRIRWATEPEAVGFCCGVAVLPTQGFVVVASFQACTLYMHRLSDGVRVGRQVAPALGFFLAADPASATLYSGSTVGDIETEPTVNFVQAWTWAADGFGFEPQGPVKAAAVAENPRPITVMPPASGKTTSHLIVSVYGGQQLLVVSLPSLVLVHTHTLTGMRVAGLAADPWGGALAVCDRASEAIHVMAWPLPGMPALA